MPTKTTEAGRTYEIDGKRFTWTTEDGDQVTIPLRIKVKVIRALGEHKMDATGMMKMLDLIIPDQGDALDEMDVLDLQAMFLTWRDEYQLLGGASLGESSGSSA